MAQRRISLLTAAAFVASGCTGDDGVIRSFHSTVRPGATLVDAIVRAEEAQRPDVYVTVVGLDCPMDVVQIGRTIGNPYVRITRRRQGAAESVEAAYSEVGYASREEFRQAVSSSLPSFYSCPRFAFEFGRDQVWPTADSFTVEIDERGRIEAVSDVRKDDLSQ